MLVCQPCPALCSDSVKLVAGQIEELVNLYSTEEILHATHPFNVGLINMPARYVPRFYQAVVDTINVQPNALSVAVLIRSLGKLNRLSQAEAIWSDWQVRFDQICLPCQACHRTSMHCTQHTPRACITKSIRAAACNLLCRHKAYPKTQWLLEQCAVHMQWQLTLRCNSYPPTRSLSC